MTISSWLSFSCPAFPIRGLQRDENFWLRLTTASVQCLHHSECSFIYVDVNTWSCYCCVYRHPWVSCRRRTSVWRGLSHSWSVMHVNCSASRSHWCATSPYSIDVRMSMVFHQHRQNGKNVRHHLITRYVAVFLLPSTMQASYVFLRGHRLWETS